MNLNGNIICAIDTETTGLNIKHHDIWEIAMIPLNLNLKQDKTRPIFDLVIKPDSLYGTEAEYEKSQFNREYIEEYGISPDAAADLFFDWFQKLNLQEGKRIIPLAHNWKYDSRFIEKWLGFKAFDYHFDGRARDSFTLALAINDACELEGMSAPFPRTNLSELCNYFGVKLENAHRAVEDAYATAEVYKSLVKFRGVAV